MGQPRGGEHERAGYVGAGIHPCRASRAHQHEIKGIGTLEAGEGELKTNSKAASCPLHVRSKYASKATRLKAKERAVVKNERRER